MYPIISIYIRYKLNILYMYIYTPTLCGIILYTRQMLQYRGGEPS